MLRTSDLPNDVETLKRLLAEKDAALEAAHGELRSHRLEIERLRLQLARLRRLQFGRSSEQLNEQIAQLEFALEELEAAEAAEPVSRRDLPVREKPTRRALPAHLPRETIVYQPHTDDESCACPECGSAMRVLGEDVPEVLEYVPERYKVIRHVRPKLSCTRCEKIVQAAAPSRPIARGLAGPAFLAHVLVSKYADHLPLYRQSQIYARAGLDLDRSTLADWVGGAHALLEPLVERLAGHVLKATHLRADDTPYPVLAPGTGKTKTARMYAMSGHGAVMHHRQYFSVIAPIVKASIRERISLALPEHCMPMDMPASIGCSRLATSKKPLVGHTCGVSSLTSMKPANLRLPKKHWIGSAHCTASKVRSAASYPMSVALSDKLVQVHC